MRKDKEKDFTDLISEAHGTIKMSKDKEKEPFVCGTLDMPALDDLVIRRITPEVKKLTIVDNTNPPYITDDLVHRPEEHGVMRRITPGIKPRPKKAKAVYPATMKVVFELINDVVIDYESVTVKNIETKELTIYNFSNHDELRNISPETHEAISIDLGKTVLYLETKIY